MTTPPPTLDEASAWRILHALARECLRRTPRGLHAIYAVGPITGGYYRPGSDLLLVLLASDQTHTTLGRSFSPGPLLTVLNEQYRQTYQLSADSGAAVLLESEQTPPYTNGLAVPVIARLKREGQALWGSATLQDMPMPTAKDMHHAARQYEQWWQSAYPSEADIFQLDLPTCAAAIREHLFRYLWIHCDQIEFHPLRQLMRYRVADPPCVDASALRLLARHLRGESVSPFEADLMRAWLIDLRAAMNAFLHIETK